ncbi:MarR family winged helix-turn-helix transcriptional regulator [Shimia sediminis]|uniref:MarR family winged helix-turn-helix transcriptional regulator n=1 Tax=Shimia sediminis TaxID=2497945 RepID=UPI000F8E822B|nr:MarR family transcriptional regulator [Shimia sediminis]
MRTHDMAGHLIRRLNQRSTQTFTQQAQAAGFSLTPVQFAAMDAIATHPGIDQAGVATMIAYDRATIGGVIDRLVQKGLVARNVSLQDRRAREVRLTEAGETLLAQILPVIIALQDDILAGLTPQEREVFKTLAAKAVHLAPEPD